MDPRCKGMPLSSFLLKPMQRVTRYPLIIKNVRRAPETHGAQYWREHTYFSLCCLSTSDLREHSRVPSRQQPSESCAGEGWGALLTGENTNHNVQSLQTPWTSVASSLGLWISPLTRRLESDRFVCLGEWRREGKGELWSSRVDSGSRPVWRPFGGTAQCWLPACYSSFSTDLSIISLIIFSSVSSSNWFLTLSPTAWVPGSSFTAASCSKPKAAKSSMVSSSTTSCCWHRWGATCSQF